MMTRQDSYVKRCESGQEAFLCDDLICDACRERERRVRTEKEIYETLQPLFDMVAFKLLRGQVTLEQVTTQLRTLQQKRSS